MKKYELYVTHPNGFITNKSIKYRTGMWIVHVKANSLDEAIELIKDQVIAKNKGVGIIKVDNSFGPGKEFPWPNELYPKHWNKDGNI